MQYVYIKQWWPSLKVTLHSDCAISLDCWFQGVDVDNLCCYSALYNALKQCSYRTANLMPPIKSVISKAKLKHFLGLDCQLGKSEIELTCR